MDRTSPSPPARPVTRGELALLGAAVAVHLGAQALHEGWIIEDAAICFAYAQNLAAGEGLVAMAGGERVEGYSDPLWVAILALFAAMGFNLYVVAKALGAVFGAAALPLSWALAREALPQERGWLPLLAPILLAGSAHHAIWSASALENSLFSLLLLGGALLLLREERQNAGFPWSAVLFFLLALTRPEGILYAAVAALWGWGWALGRGRGHGPGIRWALVFGLPWLAFLLWRIWVFAWPLPMTYYAKLAATDIPLSGWDGRGWWQLRSYASSTWAGWGMALLPVAFLGTAGRRGRLALGITLAGALLLLIPGPEALTALPFWPALAAPPAYLQLRILLLGLLGLGLPLLAIGGVEGWRARALLGHLGGAAIFFSLYSGGDWMHGLRWMSLFAPAQAILFSVGLVELLRRLPRWTGQPLRGPAGWALVAFAVSLWYAPNLSWNLRYKQNPDMTPESVKRRVDYTTAFAREVFLDEPIVNLDMDMGAHLLWSDHRMVDMAGLVDVPMALHTYGHRDPRHRAFIREYIFEERNPHFAHVHLGWAEFSNFESYPEWDRYFLLRGYADGRRFHGGVWARRDLVMTDRWPYPSHPIRFQGGIEVLGLYRMDPRAAPGWSTYLEIGIRMDHPAPITVLAFLADDDGHLASWELPLGVALRGHVQLPPERWEADEIHHGRFALRIPDDLPLGDYDLGLVVLDADGAVQPALSAETWLIPDMDQARYARGEARLLDAVRVVGEGELRTASDAGREEAEARAARGDCEGAEAGWRATRRLLPLHRTWHRYHARDMDTALSSCWTERAKNSTELATQVELLARAHRHDHRLPAYQILSEEVARQAYAQGRDARAAGDWEGAYRAFQDVLRITPHNSWARRYAEESRDRRLGLYDAQGWGGSFGPW